MSFTVTLTTVAVMLLYTVPAFILMKKRMVKKDSITTLATLLLYVGSPMQITYCIQQVDFNAYMVKYLAITLGLGLLTMGGMLLIVYFASLKKQQDVSVRICTTASVMGNCGFMGIPLLEALMPQYPQAVGFAAMYFVAYNILMWTLVSFIITRDRKFISVKKILLNPTVIAMYFALFFFFTKIRFTGPLGDMIELLNRMCTPLCMLILGMRLALVPLKPIFTNPVQYLSVALKLIVFPLFTLALLSLLPLEREYIIGIYIISAAPVGNMVLSFAELLGEGQDTAANVVILSTLLSLITIPVMMLIV